MALLAVAQRSTLAMIWRSIWLTRSPNCMWTIASLISTLIAAFSVSSSAAALMAASVTSRRDAMTWLIVAAELSVAAASLVIESSATWQVETMALETAPILSDIFRE